MSEPTPTADALQAEIEQTRAQLADTVDQLAARLDVKTRAKDRLVTPQGRPTSTALVLGGVLAVAITAVVVRGVVRRRSSR